MTRTTKIFAVLACLGAATPAHAHFVLMQPANWLTQNTSGDPQKAAPCGLTATAVQSNEVTTYKEGSTSFSDDYLVGLRGC